MEELFESDNQVSIFPAGTCAKRVNGKITEMPGKKMFVTRAKNRTEMSFLFIVQDVTLIGSIYIKCE